MQNTRAEWIWCALAVAVGLLAAIVALHTDNLQFAVLFLFVQSAVFGFARPERAWRWACLIAMCVPLLLLFNVLVTLPGPRDLGFLERLYVGPVVAFFKAPHPVAPGEIGGSCLAFLPAFAGAYVGAWMSRVKASA
jgi:hypothetical protein